MTEIFPTGKLPLDVMRAMLSRYASRDESVIVGATVGEDAAVVRLRGNLLVAKTDPITFATDSIGWYVVHVNANDIACRGAQPHWFLLTLLLPERGATPMLVDSIMAQVQAACHDLGILLVGGHTEVTYGLDRPIAIGCMLGEPLSEHIVSSSGIQLGDIIILAGAIAIEGTALIAREFTDDLRRRGFDEAFLARARGFLRDPGISVVRAARIALQCGGVHAMHDPTEGGVATGLHEMAQAAGIGLVVNTAAVPVLPECQCLCTTYGLNPLGLIASGALLVAVRPEAADSLLTAYAEAGIPAAAIATAVQPAEGIRLVDGSPLPIFTRDEVTRLF